MRSVCEGDALNMLAKPHLAVVSPSGEKRSVSRGRRPNADLRKREPLTDAEVEKLIAAARTNRRFPKLCRLRISILSTIVCTVILGSVGP